MASTPEGKVKKAVKKVLDQHKVYYFFPATGGYGRSGIPDIICCVNGQFLAIECKAEGGTTTALQRHELQKIKDAQGFTFVAQPSNVGGLTSYIATLKTLKKSAHD